MDIGRLNRRIEVLSLNITRDEYGGEEKTWITSLNLWANIKPLTGKEIFSNYQVEASSDILITIRYNPSINVLNRIKYKDKTYEILGVSDEETLHKFMILNVKELIGDGL